MKSVASARVSTCAGSIEEREEKARVRTACFVEAEFMLAAR